MNAVINTFQSRHFVFFSNGSVSGAMEVEVAFSEVEALKSHPTKKTKLFTFLHYYLIEVGVLVCCAYEDMFVMTCLVR